ncbi:MAG: cell surface protein [Lachnospiraceae bacterium]|nr:cell surface protein [Lachnospiraceae bacterium]
MIILILGMIFIMERFVLNNYIKENKKYTVSSNQWDSTKAYVVNKATIIANIDTRQLKSNTNNIFMSDKMKLMIPVEQIMESFDCAVSEYSANRILIEKGNNSISINNNECLINGEKTDVIDLIEFKNDRTFIAVELLSKVFDYTYNFDISTNQAKILSNNIDNRIFPYKYSYEDIQRVPMVGNQGNLGTCWAFAALTALSSTVMPKENLVFSVDHMTLNNSFAVGQSVGGDYSMAMAYLLAWQGPVLEKDDPYGDGISNNNIKPVKHVQEAQIIEAKDYETIKKMIFKYGGVQSSFYAYSLDKNMGGTRYYNSETNSYCYIGNNKPNHDIVIIGWDDSYPKENFNTNVENDGAFICRNSWGADFGNNGNFYISYYDTNIGVHNVVYTKVEEPDNYDNIYQTDLCGYIGQLGYNKESSYFANVYTAKEDEELMAVGFYATGIDTEYSIYVCEDFKDVSSLAKRSNPVMTGKVKNSGYYTIRLDNKIKILKDRKYAIIVRINTPNSLRPVAVEYSHNSQTANVDITDGEGYVSLKGASWESTEEVYQCNVCLKAYTNNS